MRTLIDANVVLDLLLDRGPYSDAAARVFGLAENRAIDGFLCAASVDTLHYLLGKALQSRRRATAAIFTIRRILAIAPVGADVIDGALALEWRDLEDAIVHESARLANVDAIITRNQRDFAKAQLAVLTPDELLSHLGPSAHD